MQGKADAAAIDPQHVMITEPVRGSDIPVHLMYVEMIDGVYVPIGLRTPPGQGPFPLVLFASGNGGRGMAMVRDFTQNVSWTQEEFLKAGYAVAWMRYRAEVDYAYDKIGPLEYEDVIATIEYVKTLPYVVPDLIFYMGMSHGGEMAFKIASEYHGVRAMIACEPAAHEFLRLRPDSTARINPETGLLDVERMLMREPEKVRPRITEPVPVRRAPAQVPSLFPGLGGHRGADPDPGPGDLPLGLQSESEHQLLMVLAPADGPACLWHPQLNAVVLEQRRHRRVLIPVERPLILPDHDRVPTPVGIGQSGGLRAARPRQFPALPAVEELRCDLAVPGHQSACLLSLPGP